MKNLWNRPFSLVLPVALLLLFSQVPAWGASCVGSGVSTPFNLPATLKVNRDAAVGTVIYDTRGWIGSGEASAVCRGPGTIRQKHGYSQGMTATTQDGVYASGVPGIGIKVAWSNSASNLPSEMSGGVLMNYPTRATAISPNTYLPAQRWWIQLIKTGEITSGTFNIPPIDVYYQELLTNRLNIAGSRLEFQKRGCRLALSNIPMPLPTAFLHDFKGIGSTARPREFGIPLTCDSDIRVSYSIMGLQDEPSVLKNSVGPKLAKGVGVQLLRGNNDMRPIVLGEKTFFADSGPVEGRSTIPIYAQYYQTEEKVSPGMINILATLSLFYE
ncbi:fimbrial protein [Pseudomonas sp. PDM13]|uniref:fimbrial protein n=1 Tax=Pseudomonas sp. PDM13 TaxID=2769255 RepID=UPI0021DF657A|nr:fimbrial protein [Pseudomonas sp. PDM13]MCU9949494.1 fimbrial protein [Pseudomonas sp. PDM13]